MTFRTTAGTIASVMHHLGKGASVAHVAVAVPTCAMMAQAGVHVGPQCPATSAPCPLADREPQVAVGRPCAARPCLARWEVLEASLDVGVSFLAILLAP